MNDKIDVLAVMENAYQQHLADGWYEDAERIAKARAAVAELIEALQMFVDDSEGVDLGGGDAVVTTCESLQVAVAALARAKGE